MSYLWEIGVDIWLQQAKYAYVKEASSLQTMNPSGLKQVCVH